MTRYHFSFPNAKNFMNETHSARKHVRVKKSLPLESKVRNKKEKKTLIAVWYKWDTFEAKQSIKTITQEIEQKATREGNFSPNTNKTDN